MSYTPKHPVQVKQLAQPSLPQLPPNAGSATPANPEKEALLSQLNDVYAPPSVSAWPLAPGWWLMIALACGAIAGVIMGCIHWQKKRAANRYRRTATRYLNDIENKLRSDQLIASDAMQQVNVVSKQAYFAAYPYSRIDSAGDTGRKWLAKLERTFPKQSAPIDPSVFDLSYRPAPQADNEYKERIEREAKTLVLEYIHFVREWMAQHPPLSYSQWQAQINQSPQPTSREAQHV